jgi:hypothetical protein
MKGQEMTEENVLTIPANRRQLEQHFDDAPERVMEFRSSKLAVIAAGLIFGIIGVFSLSLFLVCVKQDKNAPLYLGLLGVVFTIISPAAFTFRKVVRIDKERIQVERAVKAFFWKQIQLFGVKDFEGVGITTGSSSGDYSGPRIAYIVQLLGRKKVSIPGYSNDLGTALAKARQIAEFVNLPIDETPRMRFSVGGW